MSATQRRRITLAFNYQENWIGGTYYIISIVKALLLLEDSMRPELVIVHPPQSKLDDVLKVNYPYLKLVPVDFTLSGIKINVNRVCLALGLPPVFKIKLPIDRVEFYYPTSEAIDRSNIDSTYFWIPDLQERHLPQYFSQWERSQRTLYHKRMIRSGVPIVFSSRTSLEDFDRFYPNNDVKKVVLPFVSVIDYGFESIDINVLLKKFGITSRYFIVTNQFWKHKNHTAVVKAFAQVAKNNPDVQLVLTGKEHDYRHPEYPATVRDFVKEHNLEDRVLFLGFIDRGEQLKLMKESIAVIQPSFFEGWSTVVEDSKAIGQFILVSDIPVHREQIKANSGFFDPHKPEDLAGKMRSVLDTPPVKTDLNYADRIKDFARNFLLLGQ
jgi:glycosyltransferase involved in cell wall biosynthesis